MLETLEARELLSIVTVNTDNDVLDGDTSTIANLLASPGVDGLISLREAIAAANNTANVGGPDEIRFNIPGEGAHTIQPVSALPTITDPVIIDGYTQPGASPNTHAVGDNAVLRIELDGSTPAAADGLTIAAGQSTVKGLAINRFAWSGIHIATNGENVIAGNFIGTDVTGSLAFGNGRGGVTIGSGACSNVIGTNGDGVADEAERNVISGNIGNGVVITGAGTNNNIVAGNYFGTDVTGTAALGNGIDGVLVSGGSQFNIVGTDGDGVGDGAERNIISGNIHSGVVVQDAGTDGNIVAGNFIGTDCTGTHGLGQNDFGVVVWHGAKYARVGTNGDGVADEAERNVISGNVQSGVWISGIDSDGNTVAGNYIGTDVSGTLALGNNRNGVLISAEAKLNIIGTDGDGIADEAERNVISGNASDGVRIDGSGSDANVVAGNFIGTEVSGTIALGNGQNGVLVSAGAKSNVIGTNGDGIADEAERNIISGNNRDGVRIYGTGSDENVVAGNYIGTDVTGTLALGNAQYGVLVAAQAKSNVIGTNGDGVGDTAERNVISANTQHGVRIVDTGTNSNVVAGNYIGTDVSGALALGNKQHGVFVLVGAKFNVIGTDGDGVGDEAERNVISGNSVGVVIRNPDTAYNTVAGNFIGTDLTGTQPLANTHGLVIADGAQHNLVGTNGDGIGDTAERNIISGNAGQGVTIGEYGSGTNYNVVAGNFIGTDVNGTAALGNGGIGMTVNAGAQFSRIGTNGDGVADEAERNVISGNGVEGVSITGSGTNSNVVAGNFIGTNATGTEALGNASNGVLICGGAQENRVGTDGTSKVPDAERNVISGNIWRGVYISDFGSDRNVVAGNYIGTDWTGTSALGVQSDGVDICYGAQANRIGTNGDGVADVAERNVISGNGKEGVAIGGSGANRNVVAGNFIGTNATGTEALGNASNGVLICGGAQENRVGTDGTSKVPDAERNVISGNTWRGVYIADIETDHNAVAGNFIGVNAAGDGALPNLYGVAIGYGARNNRIGTDGNGQGDTAERNVISANTNSGVSM